MGKFDTYIILYQVHMFTYIIVCDRPTYTACLQYVSIVTSTCKSNLNLLAAVMTQELYIIPVNGTPCTKYLET